MLTASSPRRRLLNVILVMWSSVCIAEGYDFSAVYTGEYWRVTSGGIGSGSRYLDNLDLTLEVDVSRAWGFGTGTLYMYGLYNNGSRLSEDLVGDIQGVSNIDAPGALRMYEFWYEFGGNSWSVRTGLYDLNSEFDTNETGALFTNSSHGIGADLGQTGRNGPGIFPISSLALRAAIQKESFAVRLAVLDGEPGNPDHPSSNSIGIGGKQGFLMIGELDLSIAASYRIWAGYWRYSAEFDSFNGIGADNGNGGWYIGSEHQFDIGSLSAAWFVRYGQANEQYNPLKSYLGGGLVIDGPFASRQDDQLGIAVAIAFAGDPYREFLDQIGVGAARQEIEWELTYRARINRHLAMQPNIQYVQYPSASTALDNSWVVGLRFEVAY